MTAPLPQHLAGDPSAMRSETPRAPGEVHYLALYRAADREFEIRTDRLTVDRQGMRWRLREEARILARLMAGADHGPVTVEMGGVPR